jgi:hypothetical protein
MTICASVYVPNAKYLICVFQLSWYFVNCQYILCCAACKIKHACIWANGDIKIKSLSILAKNWSSRLLCMFPMLLLIYFLILVLGSTLYLLIFHFSIYIPTSPDMSESTFINPLTTSTLPLTRKIVWR